MVRPPETIRTDRLLLQKPSAGDAAEMFKSYAADPEVTRYLSWRPHRAVRDTTAFLVTVLSSWESGEGFPWSIRLKSDRRLIGMIEGRITGPRMEIGYVLARSEWERGYMTEAVKAVAGWALAQPGIHRVWAVCDLENMGSARVLEKAGMEREGILRRWIVLPNRSDVPRDCHCYSIIKP
jgi:RimJ/RimL family protein N-acetyltransferase